MRDSPTDFAAALAALGVDVGSAGSSGWVTVQCPACPGETRPSLRVNARSGQYRCFRCNAASSDGRSLSEFVTTPLTGTTGARGSTVPPANDELVARYHRFLVDSPSVMESIRTVRGWLEETIRRLEVGWDGSHLWIPIRDTDRRLVNVRLYDPFRRTSLKSFHYSNPTGLSRTITWVPFGVESLVGHQSVWMYEGEPDAILAAQMGFPTAVITGGAGTWSDDALPITDGKRVVLCYDIDAAGRRGARIISTRLKSCGRDVLDLIMELGEGHKDFTDAVMKEGWDVPKFKQAAKRHNGTTVAMDVVPTRVRLGGGAPMERVIVRAHVLGAATVPQIIPQTMIATCNMSWQADRACRGCPAGRANGNLRVPIESESLMLLQLATTRPWMHQQVVRADAGIPARCPVVSFDVDGMWQALSVKLIPPMSERSGGESKIRPGFCISPADGREPPVRPNQLYDFHGVVLPDAISNDWTLVCDDVRPAEDDIDSFRLDSEMSSLLSTTFSPREWTAESIEETLAADARAMSRHITKIYGRDEVLRAVDLTYHSVTKFRFRGDDRHRGWLAIAIAGDTRTGKTEIITSFRKHVGFGQVVLDPANTTYAGLVGGLQQVGAGDRGWTVTWGIIPVNDRGLVAIDEISSLSTDDIGKMSGMRSSGIAELTKIRSASTPARTRLIMAGNVRGTCRTLSSFGTSVEALMELIGAPEDVARFDMACACKQGLDKELVDKRLGDQPPPAPQDLRRDLVRFAWSRSSEQIVWEDGAEDLASEAGRRMAADYDASIPLVEPSEQDLKVARVAVASAARTFSVTEGDPNVILVRRCHVVFAERFMRGLYAGDLGYDDYSRFVRRQSLDEKAVVAKIATLQRDVGAVARAMLALRRVTPNTITMTLALEPADARGLMAFMAQRGAARFDAGDRNSSMAWTPEMVQLLRRLEANPPAVDEIDAF